MNIVLGNIFTVVILLLPIFYLIFIQKNIAAVKKVILLYVTIIDAWLSDIKNQEKLEKVLNIVCSMKKEFFILHFIPEKVIISWIVAEVRVMKKHLGSTANLNTMVTTAVNNVAIKKIDEFKTALIKADYKGNTNIVCNNDIVKLAEEIKNNTTKSEINANLITGFTKASTRFNLFFRKIF